MARLIVLIALALILLIIFKQFKKVPKAQWGNMYWKLILGGLGVILVLLAVTGRIHWIGAMIGALLPFIRQSIPLLIRFFPLLKNFVTAQAEASPHAPSTTNLDTNTAYSILGLQAGASKEEIITAHRKMMQKIHPDRGGSDYLAAQINQAKDLLLESLS